MELIEIVTYLVDLEKVATNPAMSEALRDEAILLSVGLYYYATITEGIDILEVMAMVEQAPGILPPTNH